MSHLKTIVRVNYSNPPAHGGLAASAVLSDPVLYAEWIGEVAEMRERIVEMRTALVDGLAARGVVGDFSYIKQQRGMFSFSGLSDAVVAWLRENKGIYVVKGGRINVAGLTSANIDYVCDSIAEALNA
jgi:aspartate/tyrosine/aromatic aminotransferase